MDKRKNILDTASKIPVLLKFLGECSGSSNASIIPDSIIPAPKIHNTIQRVTKFKSCVIGMIEYPELVPSIRNRGNWTPNLLNGWVKKRVTGRTSTTTESTRLDLVMQA